MTLRRAAAPGRKEALLRIIDISMTIRRDMPVYKNLEEKRPVHTVRRSIPPDSVNESSLSMDLHTGTHVDSPFHMIRGGQPTESLPLKRLIAPCRVLDLTGVREGITREDLEGFDLPPGRFVLLKTRNSFDEGFRADYVYLAESGARHLAGLGVGGVGIDSLGIERAQPGHGTHLALLERDILILEGLVLREVPPGDYLLIALPLKIRDADGAPARAVLIEGGLPGL